ncbi:MAG: BatA and WFA domain-containing protein, partial [Phycisphaerae bacterium]
MSFLNPIAIAIAGALTIPPLIALYFLKLKRNVQLVPTTLLWKRSVEDLQVNSPFQRLRSSLLLLLQLLVLVAAAVALGKPMFQTARTHEDTVIILIDQSASMGVVEGDGVSRLEKAKQQAKLCVDNMSDDARAMVIAFCDRATVVSSFDTNKHALRRKIDSIEQTQSRSSLGEAMSLAEAYTQNITIGTEEAGSDIAPESAAPPASVFLFTDGRIEDADGVALQRFDVDKIQMTTVGTRTDNVGIVAMDARRDYERPELLEVAATVQNFGCQPATVDAVLNVDGHSVDVQPVALEPTRETGATSGSESSEPAPGSVRVVAFDDVEFEGGGVVEVVLRVDDALSADDRAWTIIEPPRHLRVLLVTDGNAFFLENVLTTLPLDLERMTGSEYEKADDKLLTEGERSAFDVVILDRHSTGRLPQGNYFFWGAVPQIEGVSAGKVIDDQVIFNWDDTHPILRHVAVETLYVYEWLELNLPPEAVSLVDGETSPVIAYLTRDASQYLISAFSLITEDESGN